MCSYANISDEKLLDLMASGDQSAFREIYERYWSSVYKVGLKVTGSKEAAEDSVQQVFMSLWDRRALLKIAGNLNGYLATAVKYNSLSLKLQQKKRLELLTGAAVTPAALVSPDQALEEKILQEFLATVINQLPPRTREIYRFSRESELSNQEIAQSLNLSVKTVEAHITKALKAIKLSLLQIRMWTMLL